MNPFSIFDQGLVLEGDIQAEGRLVIRGTVRGRLRADHVIIACQGAVYGQLLVRRIDIAGTFEGQVEAVEHIHIGQTGCCNGRLCCQTLAVAPGAVLNAEVVCSRRSADPPAACVQQSPDQRHLAQTGKWSDG